MRAWKRFATGWILPALLSAGVAASEAEDWARQLGAPRYQDREAAERALRRMGSEAWTAVSAATHSPDPEVRIRARKLLPWVRYGIQENWPEDLRQRVLRSDQLSKKELAGLIRDLDGELGLEACGFLQAQLRGPAAEEALKRLTPRVDDPEWRTRMLADLPQNDPVEAEAVLLAAIWRKEEDLEGLLRAIRFPSLPETQRNRIPGQAADLLVPMAEQETWTDLHRLASAFLEQAPEDLRLRYLQAVALRELGQDHQAQSRLQELETRMADTESPHYTAAKLLDDLGEPDLALVEYQKILRIGPVDEVYDINALFALGRLHQDKKAYREAGDFYERGLKAYRAEKSAGTAMIGGNEEEIEKKIRMLRGLADPKSRMGEKPVAYGIEISVKGDRMQAYREMYKTRSQTVNLEFQPRGLRLLSKEVTSVHYLPETQRIVVRLNGSDMAEGIPYEWSEEGPNRLLIRSLDTRYFFDLDPTGGPAERVETFELEYRVVLELNEQVRALRNSVITLNGDEQEWKKIQEAGLHMDYLPEKLKIHIEGTTGDDIDINLKVEFDLDESLPAFP